MFNKKGFTLIEFIIVMAIIGILVLMAAPKFMDYVDRAHQSRLMNDIKVVQNTAQAMHADALAGAGGVNAYDEAEVEAPAKMYNIKMEETAKDKVTELRKVSSKVIDQVNLSSNTAEFYIDKDLNVYATDTKIKEVK